MPKKFSELPSKAKETELPRSYDFVQGSKKDGSSSSKQELREAEKKLEKREKIAAKIRGLEQKKGAVEYNIQTMNSLIADYQRAANELDTEFLAMTRDLEITLKEHQKAKDILERTSKQENKLTETTDMTAALSMQMEELHLEVKRQHLGVKQLAKEWQYKQGQRSELDQAREANNEGLKKYKKKRQEYVAQELELRAKINELKAELERLQ